MRTLLQVVSWMALAGTIVPSALHWLGRMDLAAMKAAMLGATVVWFVSAPLWMGRARPAAEGGD